MLRQRLSYFHARDGREREGERESEGEGKGAKEGEKDREEETGRVRGTE